MKERPILFSAPMVRANLRGDKTQTRRTVKDAPTAPEWTTPYFEPELGQWYLKRQPGDVNGVCLGTCPYGRPGDRLWVQESHQILATPYQMPEGEVDVEYAADGAVHHCTLTAADLKKWRARKKPFARHPGRFMYRSLSRLTLEITEVRLERLHAIQHSEADALAEGLIEVIDHPGSSFPARYGLTPETLTNRTAWAAFARVWNQINGDGAWDLNPWVFVITYRRLPQGD